MAVMRQEFKVGAREWIRGQWLKVQHRVGCIGSKAEWGGWEALVHPLDDTSIPKLLLYVSTFQNSIAVLISRIRGWRF